MAELERRLLVLCRGTASCCWRWSILPFRVTPEEAFSSVVA